MQEFYLEQENGITNDLLRQTLKKTVEAYLPAKKALIIPPDFTRCYSYAGIITGMLYQLLEERGISAERLVPQQKDWNDDLKAEQENKMERSELCQTFC